VICQGCGHDNRAAAKFCEECGSPLPRQCPACGTAARAAAKFCDECGQALVPGAPVAPAASPAAPPARPAAPAGYTPRHLAEKILTSRSAIEGERKQVSVLFVDCVGFTALSARLDPEDLHTLMDGCFQRFSDAVHRHEGTINQFTGDGVMALFGAPIAHEDHAVRAVSAALLIQQSIREYAATVQRERGLEFAVRIGINTGQVVVGKIGDDLRMDYTAQGETVNLAARLQQAAAPGGILVSGATLGLVRGYFLIEDAGAVRVKGVDEPVPTFAITGQRRRRARFDLALERGLTPLIGRERERAFLLDCLDKARRGRGNVVSLVGAAGTGKSRLLYELHRGLEPGSVTYLEGECRPHGEALPFDLIVQLLEANFGLDDGETERAQVEKIETAVERLDPTLGWTVPHLKHLLALPAPELDVEGLDEAQRKRRMVEAVKMLTLRGARHRPLVLVMEDLQWIDRSSQDYLESVVDSVAGHPILLVCSYRGEHAPAWERSSVHQRLVLDPFSEAETMHMVDALLEGAEPAPTARDLIVKRAEGNPLFIEELTGYLRDRGLLSSAGRLALAEGDVPSSIQDLLAARIDRLSASQKRTLQLAAILGRQFPLLLLEAIAAPEQDVKTDIADLARLDLLREAQLFPDVRYSFTHLLIQQVAYQGLLVKARADLHAQAGRALERLYVERPEEVLQELASQYARSSDRAKAVHYLVVAGDRARRLFAYDEAIGYFREALALLDGEGSLPGRAMVLEKLGDTAYAHGELADALAYWVGVLDIVEASEPRRAAELHRKMGAAAWDSGDRERALAHLEFGRQALGDDVMNLEAARLYQELGRVHFRLGDHAAATAWAREALALGDQLGAADVVAHAYNTLGVATARAGDIEGGAAYVQRSLETALAHQFGAIACRAYSNLAVMYATLDHWRSGEYCREGLALAQRIGDQLQQAWLYCTLAGGHCTIAGDYEEGIKAAEAAAEMDRRLGQRSHLPIPLIILAQIYQCRGDYGRSAQQYREALDVATTVGEPQLLFPCYDGLATLAIEAGDDDAAERWLAMSREVQGTTGWTSETFLVLPFLC
jgi:adenylate cyclase